MEPPVLDPSNIRKMAATHRKRQAQAAHEASVQAILARKEVERLKQSFLSLAPDIETIVLFGSLARSQWRHEMEIS